MPLICASHCSSGFLLPRLWRKKFLLSRSSRRSRGNTIGIVSPKYQGAVPASLIPFCFLSVKSYHGLGSRSDRVSVSPNKMAGAPDTHLGIPAYRVALKTPLLINLPTPISGAFDCPVSGFVSPRIIVT